MTRSGEHFRFIAGVMDWLIAGVMDWLEDRHCEECGQYIGDDRECQNAACVCSGCGERKGPYNFAEAERCSLVLPGRKPSGGATGPYSQEKDEDVAKK